MEAGFLEVKETMTFESLHEFIQEVVEFDNDHLYEFYIGKTPRKRLQTLSGDIRLNEVYPNNWL